MSGHSHWSTIQRQKGAADAKRGKTFTKVANQITIGARLGGSSDPDSNPRLRMALEEARSVNMPKENIQRAIERGLGKLAGEALEEVIYEGFGPGGVAFYLEGITDNKMRTLSDIRNIFERSGGSLGGAGSVSYMFEKKGEIRVKTKAGEKEEEMLQLIDLGAEDVEDYTERSGGVEVRKYLVYVNSHDLGNLSSKVAQAGFEIESSETVLKPNISQEITDPETAKKVLELAGKLEEHDDIQKVYANFDISQELMTKIQ